MSVFFNGRLLTTPTVETAVYDDGMAAQNAAVGAIPWPLIGHLGFWCAPRRPYGCAAYPCHEVLGGGDLLYAVEKAFSPSAETGAPGAIYIGCRQPGGLGQSDAEQ